MDDEDILRRITEVMRDTLKGARSIPPVTRGASAHDVPGWDSLSHAVLILNLESEFEVELPLADTLEMNNVGDLVDLIRRMKSG